MTREELQAASVKRRAHRFYRAYKALRMGMLMFSLGHSEYYDSDLLPFAYKKTPSLIIKVEEHEYSDDCVMVNRYA